MKQLAIIGPTASGKSDLAIKTAIDIDAYILSIDSLSIYKEIDIVSAKPTKDELDAVLHFGIDEIYPDEHFDVDIFISLYKKTFQKAKQDGKNLIIVGGTSFYLKMLLDGLSEAPDIPQDLYIKTIQKLKNLDECYQLLYDVDKDYMKKISPNDRYRIEKALLIYEATNTPPSIYFKEHPPKPVIENIDIYNIEIDRKILRDRIAKRTNMMYEMGLIDEVCYLESKYGRKPNSMGAIGIVETLEYLDAKVTKDQMLQNISTHTAQLAKRQQTFNKNQFKQNNVISHPFQKESIDVR